MSEKGGENGGRGGGEVGVSMESRRRWRGR